MKTAIVKTSFWDEEDFGRFHLDTKLVYNHLLTNPSRGLSQYVKINRAVMAARTGLFKENVELGLEQLQQMGWIIVYKDYVMLLKNHVEAKKGRFTDQAIEREIAEIPSDVICYFEKYTGTVPEHKDNNKDNNRKKEESAEDKQTFDELKTILKQPKARYNTYKDAIQDAKADGFTKDDLLKAARCLAASPFHQGKNDQKTVYATVAFLLANTRKENRRRLAKWSEMPEPPKPKTDYGF